MNLICFKCKEPLVRQMVDRKINIEGISLFDLPRLIVYSCPLCGKNTLPKESLDRISKLKNDLLSNKEEAIV
jgi:hypothetical protein